MAVVGWIFAGGFGIAALVMFILAMVGPQAMGMLPEEHVVFPVLAACFAPMAVGFSVMGVFGVRLWGRYNRLRGYLRAVRDWTWDISAIARDTMQPQDRVREELEALNRKRSPLLHRILEALSPKKETPFVPTEERMLRETARVMQKMMDEQSKRPKALDR